MNEIKILLEQQLEKLGLSQAMIPGFLKSVAHFIDDNPDMKLSEINDRLQYIGWDGVEMDYHTLQLAITWFETSLDLQPHSNLTSGLVAEWQGGLL